MAGSPVSRIGIRYFVLALPFAVIPASFLPGSGIGRPQQIHLSWSGPIGRDLTVTWVTNTPASDSQVVFRLRSQAEPRIAESTQAPLADDPGLYLHTARLGLLPEGEYAYFVGCNRSGWSSALGFRVRGGDPSPLTFAATADTGVDLAAEDSVLRMKQADPEFVLHAGDLSYAWEHPWRWNAFFEMIEPLAAKAPYMTALGNHEHEAPLGLASYLARLELPNNERYYSFDYGSLHVISLDSGEVYGPPPDDETEWLVADLERSAHDPLHPWRVVFFHFPPFSSGAHGSWMDGRKVWSPIFDQFGVSLVIGGHDHLYERTWPVSASGRVSRESYDDPDSPVYVVTGGGGEKLYTFAGDPPEWSAFRAISKETLRVTVAGRYMTISAIRRDGSLLDTFTLRRESGPHLPPLQPVLEIPLTSPVEKPKSR
ncbi:MAG TPA: metallophosphoesterase family protein [Candidatus Polarisedimenticolia bacterium]|nr:metallophosphoesterase family protein [Candidatus Polarisedimenticolia bacterium]